MNVRVTAICLVAVLVGFSPAAAADRAEVLYNTALSRERAVRDDSRVPSAQELRKVIAAYESIVRRYPRSAYCDNALWQAGNLAALAYERFGQPGDRRTAVRLLTQIRAQYPSSSLRRQVDDVVRKMDANRPAAAAAAPVPAIAAPPSSTATTGLSPADARPEVVTVGSDRPVTIRDIKRTALPDGVRVSIEMDGESSYRSERLDGPARVFFDVKGSQVVPALQDATLRFNDEVVRLIRLGRHPQSTTRIVMDMTGVDTYSVFTLYEPFRIVVDFKSSAASARPGAAPSGPVAPVAGPAVTPIAGAAVTAPDASTAAPALEPTLPPPPTRAPAPPARKPADAKVVPAAALKKLPAKPVTPMLDVPAVPAANGDGKFSLARQLGLGISRIVIDAGHGGHDPGAQANGLKEAELVLDVAQRLAKLLQKGTAIEVVMTRDSDMFIPLEERTDIANREGADLFLSIHANAARNLQARGVETYFLNFASNSDAEAVAARENSASGRTMRSLPDIVRAIALNNKIDESRDFADAVQRSMVQRLGARNKQLRNLGVKQAPFVVLIGAAMPSVLAEISFLTNKQEGQLLKTGAYRQQIAEALFDAVLRYQGSLKKMRSAATTAGTR